MLGRVHVELGVRWARRPAWRARSTSHWRSPRRGTDSSSHSAPTPQRRPRYSSSHSAPTPQRRPRYRSSHSAPLPQRIPRYSSFSQCATTTEKTQVQFFSQCTNPTEKTQKGTVLGTVYHSTANIQVQFLHCATTLTKTGTVFRSSYVIWISKVRPSIFFLFLWLLGLFAAPRHVYTLCPVSIYPHRRALTAGRFRPTRPPTVVLLGNLFGVRPIPTWYCLYALNRSCWD